MIHTYFSIFDQDIDDGSIYDKQVKVSSMLSVRWDFDILVDEDGNGISDDDWVIPSGPDGVKIPITFDEAGTYDYFCTLHPWMEGQVIVE